ncbi:MAG: hypothetical protein M1828_002499 [Chrysothrix sp. TS-e1954]|nr:MAG: hypothetical protein M1828_002499 [Chrysothrix sp. TS-e1954]
MAPSSVHLPNGQTLSVTPVFGGLSFKNSELHSNRSAFPPGWTIVLNEEDENGEAQDQEVNGEAWENDLSGSLRRQYIHRYKKPTLQNDHLFISAISNPNSAEFKPAVSPTRQIAMMLWATLWWYFHQPEPSPQLSNTNSERTAEEGRPKGEWKINLNKEGIFKGKNLLNKLERMGLITTDDSSVGADPNPSTQPGYRNMFVTRRAFWQIDARIFLFTLSPAIVSPVPGSSPFSSRPSSPALGAKGSPGLDAFHDVSRGVQPPVNPQFGPFQSTSHLPTYYPPHPPQYTFSNNIRHPIRPKPFRQGEIFYTRYIPSVGQYLSFRVASLSPKPCSQQGPWSPPAASLSDLRTPRHSVSDSLVPTLGTFDAERDSDPYLLHRWMNSPRVSHFWGENGPISHQEDFLTRSLSSRHSFPAIGCWDGKPFGYFEIYWVKEDSLGKYLGGNVGDYDRGIHCLVGEQEFRGPHRVSIWLSALVHYCWLADMRTSTVMMEPRVDNANRDVHDRDADRLRLEKYCQEVGFYKEREVAFPHKQSNLMKVQRDAWEKPII